MRKALFALILAICLCPVLFAVANPLYYEDSPEVRELRYLYADAGRVFPVSAYPLSKAEMNKLARELYGATEDKAVRASLDSLLSGSLSLSPESYGIGVCAKTSLEYDYRSQNVLIDPMLDPFRLWLNQEPLVLLAFYGSLDPRASIGIEGTMRREYILDPFNPTNLPLGGSAGNPLPLENNDLEKGYFFYNFDPLSIEFGRDRLYFGSMRDSILLSSSLPYLDMLRFRVDFGHLRMDAAYSTLELRGYDYPGSIGAYAAPNGTVASWGQPGWGILEGPIAFLCVHRFEYAFDTVRIGLTGSTILARVDNAFVLGDFFPVFSWHQSDFAANNLVIEFDADWTPLPALRLMAQYACSRINLSAIGVANAGTPTVDACIVAAEYTPKLEGGLRLDLYFEAGYTHYLWGNYDDDWAFDRSPTRPYPLARAIYRYRVDGNTNVLLPLSSPYGPGCLWFRLDADLLGLGQIQPRVAILFLSKNTQANLTTTAFEGSAAVANAPRENTFALELSLEYKPLDWLTLGLKPAFYLHGDTAWVEIGFTVGISSDTWSRTGL